MTQDSHHHSHTSSPQNHAEHTNKTSPTKVSPSKLYAIPFVLILAFGLIEFFGGIWTNSLALLSDAWHMFSDVFALGLAWFAAHLSVNIGTHKHINGQSHVEIAASAINALLMLVVVTYIIIEAFQRFHNPQPVTGGYVMLIAFAGLIVNIIVAKMLHSDDDNDHVHNHNKRAAYLHVLGDLLGSVAALIAGAVIYFTGWLQADPILSILISLLLLYVTIKLIIDIWHSYKNA